MLRSIDAAPTARVADWDARTKPDAGPPLRWLLAIAMSCAGPDSGALMCTESDIRNFAGPNFHVWINFFDGSPGCLSAASAASPYVRTSFQAGYMTLFWKHVLTPAVTAGYDLVALKDADLLLSPHTFSIREVEYWLRRTEASIVTPAIAAPSGKRAGRTSVSVRALPPSCAAVRSSLAEQLKIARTPAFERSLRRAILLRLEDDVLVTDSFMMQVWVVLAEQHFPARPGCVHLRHVTAIHLDTRTIGGAMKKAYSAKDNKVHLELLRLHPDAFLTRRLNFSRGCWSLIGEQAPQTAVTAKLAAGWPGPLGDPRGKGQPAREAWPSS